MSLPPTNGKTERSNQQKEDLVPHGNRASSVLIWADVSAVKHATLPAWAAADLVPPAISGAGITTKAQSQSKCKTKRKTKKPHIFPFCLRFFLMMPSAFWENTAIKPYLLDSSWQPMVSLWCQVCPAAYLLLVRNPTSNQICPNCTRAVSAWSLWFSSDVIPLGYLF